MIKEERVRGAWLRGAGSEVFNTRYETLRASMTRSGEPVLVAEKDPITFMATFFSALLADRAVVLGNPTWGREEWRQVKETLQDPGMELLEGSILIPTGGSGGRIRFAHHSWESLAAAAEGFAHFFGGEPVRSVCVLPLFHVSGLMQVIRALVTDGEVELFDWSALMDGPAGGAGGRFLSLVPTQLRRLMEVEKLHPWLRESKAIPLGGAAASAALLDEAARREFPIALSYGATETAAMVTAQTPDEFLRGGRTCGRALSHVSVRIVDSMDRDVSPGVPGRIRVAGSSLFSRYVPGEVRERPDWDSGDLGFLDTEGRLVVTGREDRIVNTGGEKVSPEEVEEVLVRSGRVADVWVFGSEDAEWGQVMVAAYVPIGAVEVGELEAIVRSHLAPFKVPKVWVAMAEIPRSDRGKVDRMVVEETLRLRRKGEGRG